MSSFGSRQDVARISASSCLSCLVSRLWLMLVTLGLYSLYLLNQWTLCILRLISQRQTGISLSGMVSWKSGVSSWMLQRPGPICQSDVCRNWLAPALCAYCQVEWKKYFEMILMIFIHRCFFCTLTSFGMVIQSLTLSRWSCILLCVALIQEEKITSIFS